MAKIKEKTLNAAKEKRVSFSLGRNTQKRFSKNISVFTFWAPYGIISIEAQNISIKQS